MENSMNVRNFILAGIAAGVAAGSAVAQTSWTMFPSPNPSSSSNQLYGIGGTGPNDVWAVGMYVDSASNSQSLALHWDGAQWTQSPTPTPSAGFLIKAVAAL